MSRQVWPDIVNRNVEQPSRVQLTRPDGVTDVNVYDVVPIPGTIQAEGTKINEALFDQMEQYIKEYDIPVVNTTGTGAAYVVSVPVWVNLTQTELDGHILCIIPKVVSTSTTPTLNMNGLGAKPICTPSGSSTGEYSALPVANYITANVPLYLIYNKTGDCWITMNAVSTPVATKSTLGGVKVDDVTIKVRADGTIYAELGGISAKDAWDSVSQVLFESAAGTTSSTITLSQSAENFKYLEIYFKSNDGVYGMAKAHKPNGKLVVLQCGTITGAEGAGWLKSKQFKVNGAQLVCEGFAGESGTGPQRVGVNYTGSILVTSVVGCMRA